jgi:hypothetical protein
MSDEFLQLFKIIIFFRRPLMCKINDYSVILFFFNFFALIAANFLRGGTIPDSGMKFRVGMSMGMGTAENSGYGYTHFWVWPNTGVLGIGIGIAHKILGALKIT